MRHQLHHGIALSELIIVLGLGSGALLSLTSLIAGSVGVNSRLLSNARLNAELGNVFALMQADLRRAGYSAGGGPLVNQVPAVGAFNGHLLFGQYAGEPANSCVTFRYDANSDGIVNTTQPNERFGYRLHNQSVEIRKAGHSCQTKGWEDITDTDRIIVTVLTFHARQQRHAGIPVTHISISLSGYLVSNPFVSATYQTTVKVNNHVG